MADTKTACECEVLHEGRPVEGIVSVRDKRLSIKYCPLHAAAPELLQALNNIAKLAHKNTKNHNDWISFRECSQAACKAATEAIRKAESK